MDALMVYDAFQTFGKRLEHIKILENIKKRALKRCRNNSPLKWDTLTERRTRIRLCAMFKTYRAQVYNLRSRELASNSLAFILKQYVPIRTEVQLQYRIAMYYKIHFQCLKRKSFSVICQTQFVLRKAALYVA
ncbi:hypothetical protein ANN_23520 [Periplaneta americana]|uniref:Uncharacterized protein n=1 Tax=Periplaneta americana TaxID=6978 RepID=A0ABQ8SLR6_PERAM|nr:hypothetical protein ANN_23520 [Periplaneta americana]